MMLAKHYWKKKRGFASADTMEQVFLCYKGKMPKGLPAERWFVHKGSKSYLQHLYHVPVCPPKELTWVDREVRQQSLKGLVAPAEKPKPDNKETPLPQKPVPQKPAPTACKQKPVPQKRRLYRAATNTSEVWFPHDNSGELCKELVWQAGGSEKVKWVLHGTPAAGNGVLGMLESGCNVIALAVDEHHKEHFKKACVEKAAEIALSGKNCPFGSSALLLKAKQLKVIKEVDDDKNKEEKKDAPKVEDPPKKKAKVEAPKKKNKKSEEPKKKKAKVEKSDSSEEEEDSDDATESD